MIGVNSLLFAPVRSLVLSAFASFDCLLLHARLPSALVDRRALCQIQTSDVWLGAIVLRIDIEE